jgi:hypothetical protein
MAFLFACCIEEAVRKGRERNRRRRRKSFGGNATGVENGLRELR